MPLKPRMANAPKTDEQGFVVAELADITFFDADESEYDQQQYLFDFLAEGKRNTVNMKLWTGITINPHKYENGSSKEYSKLTKLMLNLGLVTEQELQQAFNTGKDIEIDLEALKGKQVKFKLKKNPKRMGLATIDLDTIQHVKIEKVTAKV